MTLGAPTCPGQSLIYKGWLGEEVLTPLPLSR
jgi:hypothetical protein